MLRKISLFLFIIMFFAVGALISQSNDVTNQIIITNVNVWDGMSDDLKKDQIREMRNLL